jgi:hypothetical protein
MKRFPMTARTVTVLAFLAIAVATGTFAQNGTPWPEADKLFHSDPRWLGADAAYSIDLGHGRVLWMFGDTFVATKPGQTRATAAFVRNTVAIQTGYNPSSATIQFYWRTRRGHPTEIFPSEGKLWMWPTSGFQVGGALILFCDRVVPDSSKNSLGFRLVGWIAYQVTNPDHEPSAWELKRIAGSEDKVLISTAVLREGRYMYLLGEGNPEHELYLARMCVEAAAEGKLDDLEWWSGNDWQTGASSRRPLIRDGGTEASLQRDPRGDGFLEINSLGFGATDIGMRRAPHLEGPWTAPKKIYHPPESDAPDAFVYAGKSHPELIGADLVVTYVANGDDKRLATDMNIYFPRFVKVDLQHVRAAPAK